MKYDKLDHYSIWLETDNAKGCVHQEMISDISRTANTTAFAPHITLVGNIKKWPIEIIINKIKELTKDTCEFDVSFKYLFSGSYWLNVIVIFPIMAPQLLKLHLKAKRTFEKRSLFYIPHLSLLYGKVPKELKRRIDRKVRESHIIDSTFTVRYISLWHCSNGVANWKQVVSIPLKSRIK